MKQADTSRGLDSTDRWDDFYLDLTGKTNKEAKARVIK
jgi:hypothetical protein